MKYKVTLEILSPLHIGTGTELLKDFDYVSTKEMTYVINQDAVYSAEFDSRGGEARLNVPPGRLVSEDQWRENSPLVRYTLQGSTSIERVHEQIKDIHGCCYLPGSSLKGALRTSLLAYAMLNETLSQARINYRQTNRGFVKEAAAQNFEQAFFRPAQDDANHDFLRALHVFDSLPLPILPSRLVLCPARVFTGGLPGSPIVVEAVQKGAIFETEILIDELELQYADKLGWEDRRLWLVNLLPILQAVSRRRIQQENQNAGEKGFITTEKFYQQLNHLAGKLAGTNSAVVQMGWGTGWSGMTIGPWLQKPVQDEARQKFQLGRPPGQRGGWEPDLSKPFPKSRRLRAANESPGEPLGWIAVTFEPLGQPSELWQTLAKESRIKPISPPTSAPTKSSAAAPPAATPSSTKPEVQAPPASEVPSKPPTPPPPAESKRPLTASFSGLPKAGDRFRGNVWFTDDNGSIYIEIPGLSADDLAAALIARTALGSKKYKDGDTVICEVLAAEKDPNQKGHWLVRCVLD